MRRIEFGVPDYGNVIERSALIDAVDYARPSLLVLSAPAGYGKSILAAQVTDSPRFVRKMWIDASGEEIGDDLLACMAQCVGVQDPPPVQNQAVVSCMPIRDAPDPRALERALEVYFAGESGCLVLDGASACAVGKSLARLDHVVAHATSGQGCVVVTTRSATPVAVEEFSTPPMLMDAQTLRFSDVEARALLTKIVRQGSADHEYFETLVSVCNGHAALLSVCASHPGFLHTIDKQILHEDIPLGVAVCVRHLVTHGLTDRQKSVFLVATLLGTSTCGCISRLSGESTSARDLRSIADAIPLVRLSGRGCGPQVCAVHDLALAAILDCRFLDDLGELGKVVWRNALLEMEVRRDYSRIAQVLLSRGDEATTVDFLERCGARMVLEGQLEALKSLVDGVAIETRLQRPVVLLVVANLLRHSDRLDEAIEEATVAADLSVHFGNSQNHVEALLLLGRMYIDKGMCCEALSSLSGVCRYDQTTTVDALALYHGLCANAEVGTGRRDAAESHLRQIERLLASRALSPDVRAQCLNWLAFMNTYVIGDVERACSFLSQLIAARDLPLASKLQAQGNLGTLHVEMGRIAPGTESLSKTVEQCRGLGLVALAHEYEGSLAMAHAANSEWDCAEGLSLEGVEQALALGYDYSAFGNAVLRSVWRRARGDLDGALADAECVVGRMPEDSATQVGLLAKMERAATLLSMGDVAASREAMSRIRASACKTGSAYHLLRADMVLAEIDRIEGDFSAAVERLAAHRDYVASESANWQIAMYLRAFPGLLGVFVKALGTETLPSHLIRMVQRDHARRALDASAADLSGPEFQRMCVRLLGKRGATAYLRERAAVPKATVRLFGGMEVTTPSGPVSDKDWRKRKARLLFALLVIKRGHEVPREQVYDHFWPDMDAERAKSNFYVTWSMLKRALAGGGKRADACPYVEHVGGVCKLIPGAVASDYADFEDALNAMRKADRVGDASLTLASAERIAEIYRGELLPGEMYDEWLAPIRDRCRHDFGDAMLRASQLCDDAGETEKALHMVRAALAQDPWREDLYQSALRYLIQSGQRSGAIETYVACKSKLAEDLGLDPSTETQRLYDQILAMEEPPQAPKK